MLIAILCVCVRVRVCVCVRACVCVKTLKYTCMVAQLTLTQKVRLASTTNTCLNINTAESLSGRQSNHMCKQEGASGNQQIILHVHVHVRRYEQSLICPT